jgi:hypothetical protein
MRHRAFVTICFGLLLGLLLRILAAALGPLLVAGPLIGCVLYVVVDIFGPAPSGGSRITSDLVTFFGGIGIAIAAIGLLGMARPDWRPWFGDAGLIFFPLYAAVRVVLECRAPR